MTTLSTHAQQFVLERSYSLCQTTLATDYGQFLKWIARCPIQDLHKGREAMSWVLSQQPCKSSRKVAVLLRAFYKWAAQADVGLLTVNPVSTFRFPKAPQGEIEVVVIPQTEMPFVMAGLELRADNPNRWDLVARFMHQTALRTGEVFALKAEDIKGDKLLVHKNLTLTHGLKESTKTNRKRKVPLNTTAIDILKQLDSQDGFLFPWNRHAFQSFFRDRMHILHSQGVISRRYRPYDLRHTAITQWLEAGVPVAQVALWAGNSAEVIWKHYAGASEDYAIPTL